MLRENRSNYGLCPALAIFRHWTMRCSGTGC